MLTLTEVSTQLLQDLFLIQERKGSDWSGSIAAGSQRAPDSVQGNPWMEAEDGTTAF